MPGTNITAPDGVVFTADSWAADPQGASQPPYTKLMFGVRGSFVLVDDLDGNRAPVSVTNRGVLVDHAGSTAGAGASHPALAANPNRKYLVVINPLTALSPLYVNFTAVANGDTSSWPLSPGEKLIMTQADFVTTEAVNVWSADANHAYGCKEG